MLVVSHEIYTINIKVVTAPIQLAVNLFKIMALNNLI